MRYSYTGNLVIINQWHKGEKKMFLFVPSDDLSENIFEKIL